MKENAEMIRFLPSDSTLSELKDKALGTKAPPVLLDFIPSFDPLHWDLGEARGCTLISISYFDMFWTPYHM